MPPRSRPRRRNPFCASPALRAALARLPPAAAADYLLPTLYGFDGERTLVVRDLGSARIELFYYANGQLMPLPQADLAIKEETMTKTGTQPLHFEPMAPPWLRAATIAAARDIALTGQRVDEMCRRLTVELSIPAFSPQTVVFDGNLCSPYFRPLAQPLPVLGTAPIMLAEITSAGGRPCVTVSRWPFSGVMQTTCSIGAPFVSHIVCMIAESVVRRFPDLLYHFDRNIAGEYIRAFSATSDAAALAVVDVEFNALLLRIAGTYMPVQKAAAIAQVRAGVPFRRILDTL